MLSASAISVYWGICLQKPQLQTTQAVFKEAAVS